MVFLRFFISNVIPKTNTKVRHGCWWGVAVEISTKNAKMKNLFENNHLYECATFHEFGRHFFSWSWIWIYVWGCDVQEGRVQPGPPPLLLWTPRFNLIAKSKNLNITILGITLLVQFKSSQYLICQAWKSLNHSIDKIILYVKQKL